MESVLQKLKTNFDFLFVCHIKYSFVLFTLPLNVKKKNIKQKMSKALYLDNAVKSKSLNKFCCNSSTKFV